MYGRLADAKLLCGGTDGGPVLYDVKSQALGPVLHISLQTIHSPPCGGSVYAAGEGDMSIGSTGGRGKSLNSAFLNQFGMVDI